MITTLEGHLRLFWRLNNITEMPGAKSECPEKARNVLYNVSLLSFNPGPNRVCSRTLSVLSGPVSYNTDN